MPIGTVHNGIAQAHRDTPWKEIESDIVVVDEWREALDGLDAFSHIWVLFYFHRIPPATTTHAAPLGRADLSPVGRFAIRTPERPNPIGMTPVELLAVNGATLRVRGLDALDGTPVLDLKPYLARRDAIQGTRVPEWVIRMWGSDEPPSRA
jgi:tRNA (adenine37-N6)-methyltransferase